MSLFALAGPAQAALPLLRNAGLLAVGAIRPLFSLSIFFATAMLFRPLIVGVMRAAILLVKPRESSAVRRIKHHLRGVAVLNRMARDMDSSQPNVAAELRAFAARD